ncbi:MAG TPA: 23S rRNA (adenine(2503)-C(2))-methyltransferase RlmN [Dehalococcoidia bacterium]|nr:23S rRNA (adenine(2503)-C(2))-methyltransferase RlmN [Dehalococcoidia bacterium]
MTARAFWDLTPADLRERLAELGEPAYRADQLCRWVYQRFARGYEEMTDLPARLRGRLAVELPLATAPVLAEQYSRDGSTRKALLQLDAGTSVESVLMQYDPTEQSRARATVCVSTQAGCAMGCVFCATGQQGFLRNLATREIAQQVMHFARELHSSGERLSNIVFMGMGEPLANYAATLRAVRILSDPLAFALGQRRITVSTVGLVPQMRRLAAEGLQIGLAVSLHSPDDALRHELVPTARTSIAEILAAADEYTVGTGRRYSVEYALIDRTNDSLALAKDLAVLLRGRPCHVNLIPLNPTANGRMRRPSRQRVLAFERVLREGGANVTVRVEKGVEIAAACGQLRGEQSGRRAAV